MAVRADRLCRRRDGSHELDWADHAMLGFDAALQRCGGQNRVVAIGAVIDSLDPERIRGSCLGDRCQRKQDDEESQPAEAVQRTARATTYLRPAASAHVEDHRHEKSTEAPPSSAVATCPFGGRSSSGCENATSTRSKRTAWGDASLPVSRPTLIGQRTSKHAGSRDVALWRAVYPTRRGTSRGGLLGRDAEWDAAASVVRAVVGVGS